LADSGGLLELFPAVLIEWIKNRCLECGDAGVVVEAVSSVGVP